MPSDVSRDLGAVVRVEGDRDDGLSVRAQEIQDRLHLGTLVCHRDTVRATRNSGEQKVVRILGHFDTGIDERAVRRDRRRGEHGIPGVIGERGAGDGSQKKPCDKNGPPRISSIGIRLRWMIPEAKWVVPLGRTAAPWSAGPACETEVYVSSNSFGGGSHRPSRLLRADVERGRDGRGLTRITGNVVTSSSASIGFGQAVSPFEGWDGRGRLFRIFSSPRRKLQRTNRASQVSVSFPRSCDRAASSIA